MMSGLVDVHVKMPEELVDRLDRVVEELKRRGELEASRSSVIRRALKEYLDRLGV